MTLGIGPLVWMAAALLGLVGVAFVVAELVPSLLFHDTRSIHPRTARSRVTNGRVFCRVQRADIDFDNCIGCTHLRVMDGRMSYIVCDGRAAVAINLEL